MVILVEGGLPNIVYADSPSCGENCGRHVCTRSNHPHSAEDQTKGQKGFKTHNDGCNGSYGGRVGTVVVVVYCCFRFSAMSSVLHAKTTSPITTAWWCSCPMFMYGLGSEDNGNVDNKHVCTRVYPLHHQLVNQNENVMH